MIALLLAAEVWRFPAGAPVRWCQAFEADRLRCGMPEGEICFLRAVEGRLVFEACLDHEVVETFTAIERAGEAIDAAVDAATEATP